MEEILESGSIFYPSKSAKDNVEFLPGYGLRKLIKIVYSLSLSKEREFKVNKYMFSFSKCMK